MNKLLINIKHFSKRKTIILLVILFILSSLFMYFSFKKDNTKSLSSAINITRVQDYKVYLYDNTYIQKEFLEKNETYISELIKNILYSFEYNLSSSVKNSFTYSYKTYATINGEYQTNLNTTYKSIWKKDYILKEEKDKRFDNTTKINIKDNVNIDFNKFNSEVSDFRKTLKLAVTSYLVVTTEIKVTDTNEKNEAVIVDEATLSMKIPLNEQAFNITETYDKDSNILHYVDLDDSTKINIFPLILACILIFLFISLIIINFKVIIDSFKNKNEYDNILKKLKKSNHDILVEISSNIETEKYQKVDVANFEEMLDLQAELRIPILLFENKDIKKSYFYIINNNLVYSFILE